jgi:hypothetical protein
MGSISRSYQANYFEKRTSVEIPFTKKFFTKTNCMTCETTKTEAKVN